MSKLRALTTGGASRQARQIENAWSQRALQLAVLLSACLLVSLLVAQRGEPEAATALPQASRQFSPNLSHDELLNTIKASLGAYKHYIQYDRVASDLDALDVQFANITSEGELVQVFRHLAQKSSDDWFRLLNDEQYQDLTARRGGAEIGIEMVVTFNAAQNGWRVDSAGTQAISEGVAVGDIVTAVQGSEIPSDPALRQQITEGFKRLLANGLLHSTLSLSVLRDGKPQNVYLTYSVRSWKPAFTIADFKSPIEGPQKDVQEITFQHLEGATMVADLYRTLSVMSPTVRGVLVDLRNLQSGDPDRAVQVAAMFLESGALSHRIDTTGDGKLLMKSYVIEGGKVHRRTWGPYAVEPNGAIDPAIARRDPTRPDKEEVLDWPTNVLRVPVLALTGRDTSGAGELIAAAFTHNWNVGDKRAMTMGALRTRGVGAGRTYFPVGPYWCRVATSCYLQPDGTVFEQKTKTGLTVGPQPNKGLDTEGDELEPARFEMVNMLNVVPLPEIPKFPADK